MEPVTMKVCNAKNDSFATLPFARSYQLEALEKAMKQNTIVFLETGSGKTLIAVMLLRSYAHLLRRPAQSYIAVFLVPTVVLVTQQAEVIKMHTDLKVGKYWGDMGVDFWDAATWQKELDEHEVLVMTPKILLDALSHTYIKPNMIKVLIFDECHNARGNHPYVRIMKDFYHQSHIKEVPRIFGMTASPIKAKAKGSDPDAYWKDISLLENLMMSKVYTCVSEAVLAEYVPFPNAKAQLYDKDAPNASQMLLIDVLNMLRDKHISAVRNLGVEESIEQSICSKLKKLSKTCQFCLDELGFWAALKAAEILSSDKIDIFSWGELDVRGERTLKAFSADMIKEFATYKPSGVSDCNLSISNVKANKDARIISSKVLCLVEALLGYRCLKDLRCIIFVERVVTAMVLETILDQLLQSNGWRARYIAGNQSALKSQSRKEQNSIVEEFRRGVVNILVATSILEEGLDVQSCNLVIRFDPSANICSFIQSRGRARMLNSDFLLMVRRGDDFELSRAKTYLSSGDQMRKECLSHAVVPCQPIDFDEFDKIVYRVPSTGAIVTLSSSVNLIYFYCSRLPSDGYFKPTPRCIIDEDLGTCTLLFPNSCPLQSVSVKGNKKMLKHLACLEACKKLHEKGALTDTLVPDIVVEEGLMKDIEREPYNEDQSMYIPHEIVGEGPKHSSDEYYSYLMELKQDFYSDIAVHDIIMLSRTELASDVGNMHFDMEVDWGNMSVNVRYTGRIHLTNEQVALCRKFQVALLGVLRDHDLGKLVESLKGLENWENDDVDVSLYDYLLVPHQWVHQNSLADWECNSSASFLRDIQSSFTICNKRKCVQQDDVYTKNGYLHRSVLEKCLVCTPHNGYFYSISGFLDGLNGNSFLSLKDGEFKTYKSYFKMRHGIDLQFQDQTLLCGRQVFRLRNYLLRCKTRRERESSGASVELPPELCLVILSPISVATLYTFSFIPSIMHRVESLLLSANLRSTIMTEHCTQNVIPATKVLEALTTKRCQEKFHLESLETLGDSFLKYAVCQQLFESCQNNHEGLLSIKKERIISNAALCKLGCQRKIPGFIRYDSFDPKTWMIPGNIPANGRLKKEYLSSTFFVYNGGLRKIKSKRVADVVEALIGAFLSSGGEAASIMFMKWLGIKLEFSLVTHPRNFPVNPRMLVNITHVESLLNYSFKDPSLVVEALTHGSYLLPEVPRCYQRLEFLGDAVLDHLITIHLYSKYPEMTPGLLTDLRSASVNNECYALCALRAGLHKHILHASQTLYKQMAAAVASFEQSSVETTFGWESEISFPKVLADIIESLAGAIFVDSGFNKEVVFKSISPLLEPLVTPETLKLNPIRELHFICQKHHYIMKKKKTRENGVASIKLEVEANGSVYTHTCTASNKEMATKLASKAVLKSLKESIENL
ncbi:Endoribonuclease Dicer-like protein 2 [Bienertia sinuspersici]